MNKEFIPYEQTLELKKLGFDEPCLGHYTIYSDGEIKLFTSDKGFRNLEAPTFSQAFRWFREKYQLFSWVKVEYEYGGYSYGIYITGVRQSDIACGPYSTYEEAELACLKKLIEIAKK